MIGGAPPLGIEESVAAVSARIREWISLQIPGIVWIRYVSDLSRELVLERLSFATAVERIEFDPPEMAQAMNWFEDQLKSIAKSGQLPVVAVEFSAMADAKRERLVSTFQLLNLRRESIARLPLVQLWLIPAFVAATVEAAAPDLASWFQIRMTLSEIAPAPPTESTAQREEHFRPPRSRQSLKSLQDAVARQRQLAELDPSSYLPPLAAALKALGQRYSETNQLKNAEASFQEALSIYSRLVNADTDAHQRDLASTLIYLGNLYSDTQRMKQAEQSYQEALTTYRRVADANPDAYLPYVAMTLNNLANLYRDTQRMKEAEQSYQEALTTYRRVADANPETYLPDVAGTLNNLAILYNVTQRMQEAEQSFQEALTIRRRLAEANPEAYLPDVAMTLNNLAVLYRATQRTKEANHLCGEARAILEPLWQANPELHGNQFARINLVAADLAASDRPEEACHFARQALTAAYDPALKESAKELIDQFCPSSNEPNP